MMRLDSGNLDIPIDSTSLEQYMLSEFGDMPDLVKSFGTSPDRIVEELRIMGVETLSRLAQITPDSLKDVYIKNNSPRTYYGIISDILLIHSPKLFLKSAFKGDDWELQTMQDNSTKELAQFNVDINSLIEKYRKHS